MAKMTRMARSRALEAAKGRQSGARAPRKRAPLEEYSAERLKSHAKNWMSLALRRRDRDPMGAIRYAERAARYYLAASKKAVSEREQADLRIHCGRALSFAAKVCEKKEPRRAGRFHEDAGDHFHAGARYGTKLVERLTPESCRLLAELGKPSRISTFYYIVAYEYFMAACEGRLIEAEVMGERFKYFLIPADKIGDTPGRVNERAIAVSEDVPENLRPVVAYHEFVEGQGQSHEKAKEVEIEAVRSLGLEQEYVKWLREMGPKVRKPREFEGAFR